jgi:hypothetical protein
MERMMSENKSLLELVSRAASLEEMLIQSGGEITPELEAELAITEISLPEKIDGYSLVIDRMDSIAEFYKRKADMILKLSRAASNVSDRCKFNLKSAMQTLGTEEILGFDVKFKLVNSNPSCVIDDESIIDGAYIITETITKVDKKRLTEDLKLGIPCAGARLERGVSLRQYANNPAKKAVSK